MAIDYYLASTCHLHNTPVVRFYGWEPYCLSIGCHQQKDEVSMRKLQADGYSFTRRPTGGRAILHAQELTYSAHFPKKMIRQQHLFYLFHKILTEALKQLGYPAELKNDEQKLPRLKKKGIDYPCFTKSAQTEVQCCGKKVIGSAQKILKDGILQHGSILIGDLHEKLPDYLKLDKIEKYTVIKDMKAKSISLSELSPHPIQPETLMTSIINQLELITGFSVNLKNLQNREIEEARQYLNKFC